MIDMTGPLCIKGASKDLTGMNPRTGRNNAPFGKVLPVFEEFGVCRGTLGVFLWRPLHPSKSPGQNISR